LQQSLSGGFECSWQAIAKSRVHVREGGIASERAHALHDASARVRKGLAVRTYSSAASVSEVT
jgi:hypothetical protein